MNPKYQYCPWCSTPLIVSRTTDHESPVVSASLLSSAPTNVSVKAELTVGHQLKICPKENCGFTHWNNPIPVVVTLISRRHKLALVKRKFAPQAGFWCPPCGFVDELESLPCAARRESKEESSLVVEVEQIPFAIAAPRGVNEIISFFRATKFHGTLEAGDDAAESGWFSVDDCPELAFSTHRVVITQWFNRPQVRAWRCLAKVASLVGIEL